MDRAIRNICAAKHTMEFHMDDPFDWNIVGFLSNQAVGLALHHFLERVVGNDYIEEHSIVNLLRQAKDAELGRYIPAELVSALESGASQLDCLGDPSAGGVDCFVAEATARDVAQFADSFCFALQRECP